MYFNQLLGACSTQKLVETFFQPFSTFFDNFKPFTVISLLKSTKKSENEQKKSGFVYSSKLVDMQIDSLRGYLEIVCKRFKIIEKGWNTQHAVPAQKDVQMLTKLICLVKKKFFLTIVTCVLI